MVVKTFCSTSLPLASTRWVWMTSSSLCPLFLSKAVNESLQHRIILISEKFWERGESNPPSPPNLPQFILKDWKVGISWSKYKMSRGCELWQSFPSVLGLTFNNLVLQEPSLFRNMPRVWGRFYEELQICEPSMVTSSCWLKFLRRERNIFVKQNVSAMRCK